MIDLATSMGPRVRLSRAIAEGAGRISNARFGQLRESAHITRKGEVDFATEADRLSEAHIVQAIRQSFPHDAIVGEEGGEMGPAPAEAAWTWYVDPLDGTTNFMHGVRRFAVSIGLACEGRLVAGVVHDPIHRETWYAWEGGGAFCDGPDGERRVHVSSTTDVGDALVATGFPYDRRQTAPRLLPAVQRVMQAARGVRRQGAAALDFVDVAAGVFDGFWEPRLKPWDMAAGVVLVREAGGTVTAYGGAPFDLHGDSMVCSNGLVHEALVALVGDA